MQRILNCCPCKKIENRFTFEVLWYEGSQHIGLRFEEVRVVVVVAINTDLQSVHPNIYTKVHKNNQSTNEVATYKYI